MTEDNLQRVEIIWKDACGEYGYEDIEDARKKPLATLRSVGYILNQDEEQVIIVQTTSLTCEHVSGRQNIPRVNIISLTTI